MIIQHNNSSKISLDLINLEGAVIASIVPDNPLDDASLERALLALEEAFPNLDVRYFITPKKHGADNHQVDPEDVVAGVQWIKIHPPGQLAGNRRLEPLMGEHGELKVGFRNQHIVARSLEKCSREFHDA